MTKKEEKEELVDDIIDDLKMNKVDSEYYIWILVREALMKRTIEDLKNINI